MPAYNDMFDLEVLDGVLDDAERIQVARVQDIGDVAVNEDISRLEAEDGSFGDARVGAANPEDLGGLAFGESGEEVRAFGGGFLRPFFILGEGAGEEVWVKVKGEMLIRTCLCRTRRESFL